MNVKQRILTNLNWLGLSLAFSVTMAAAPLGDSFSYQGKLHDGGQPAQGIYDMVFTLYDSSTNQVPIYSGVLLQDVAVTDGVFTAEVDFGTDLFTGQDLWLEMAVRPGEEDGNFALLSPRQHVTAAPYAHYARKAAVAETALSVENVSWASVENLPPSFADGQDDDTTYTAAEGLSLSPANAFSVAFEGSGLSPSAARADHVHFNQTWTGATNNVSGLTVHNKHPEGVGIIGKNDEYGSGITAWQGAGVVGDSSTDPGVAGFSNTGPAIYGTITALFGVRDVIKGENPASEGRAVAGYATSTNGANIGTLGQTESSAGGVGVRGFASATTGTSYGGRFSNKSPDGAALQAYSEQSVVADLQINNAANNDPVLVARTTGTGHAGKFTISNFTSTRDALVAEHNGAGDALYASTLGSGNAGHFNLVFNHTNNAALLATGVGSARAIKAISSNGEAIRAETSFGAAITALADAGAEALTIEGGRIRVKGAGVNSATAVFIHRCTSGNTPAFPGGNFLTVIDQPMCNNNPSAILFATPRLDVDDYSSTSTYEDVVVGYSSVRGKWCLLNASIADEFGDFDVGDSFNIMVIQP